jgi:hypothetical protein
MTTTTASPPASGAASAVGKNLNESEVMDLLKRITTSAVGVRTAYDDIVSAIASGGVNIDKDAVGTVAKYLEYQALDKNKETSKIAWIANANSMDFMAVAGFYAILMSVRGNVVRFTESKFTNEANIMLKKMFVGQNINKLGVLKPSVIGLLFPYFQWGINMAIIEKTPGSFRDPVTDSSVKLHKSLRFSGAAGLIAVETSPTANAFIQWVRANDAVINQNKGARPDVAERYARNAMKVYAPEIIKTLPPNWLTTMKGANVLADSAAATTSL